MVAIFPKLCLWRRSLCSNLGGIDPEKLYRATLKVTSVYWENPYKLVINGQDEAVPIENPQDLR